MAPANPRARLAGLLYLLLLPTTGMAFATGRAVLGADAVATIANLQASRTAFAAGTFVGAIGFVDYLLLALALYRLFSPIGRDAAALLLAFVGVSVPISLAAMSQRIDALALLDGGMGAQAAAAAWSADHLLTTSAIFWGLWLLPLGWLVFRSGLRPRALGVLLALGSVFYLAAFAGAVLVPKYDATPVASGIGIFFGIPGIVGELGFTIALLWGSHYFVHSPFRMRGDVFPLASTPSMSSASDPIMKSTCTLLRLPPARSKASSLRFSPPSNVNL